MSTSQNGEASEQSKPHELGDYVRSHLGEIVIGAFSALLALCVALITYIATSQRDQLVKQIKDLEDHAAKFECQTQTFMSDYEFQMIESGLGGVALADLKPDSIYLKRLSKLAVELDGQKTKCPRMSPKLERVLLLKSGLTAFIGEKFEEAIVKFGSIQPESSLQYRFLGASYLFNADKLRRFKDPKANEQQNLGRKALHIALQLAGREQDSDAKERITMHMHCIFEAAMPPEERTEKIHRAEIDCFMEVVDRGIADYNTYYNLAVVYARLDAYEQTIAMLKKCADLNASKSAITKLSVETDTDFAKIRQDARWASQFNAQAARFKNTN